MRKKKLKLCGSFQEYYAEKCADYAEKILEYAQI